MSKLVILILLFLLFLAWMALEVLTAPPCPSACEGCEECRTTSQAQSTRPVPFVGVQELPPRRAPAANEEVLGKATGSAKQSKPEIKPARTENSQSRLLP